MSGYTHHVSEQLHRMANRMDELHNQAPFDDRIVEKSQTFELITDRQKSGNGNGHKVLRESKPVTRRD
jgi:hypothetical protein